MPDPRFSADTTIADAFRRLRRSLALTRAGLLAERVMRAFWPFGTVLMMALAALMLDAQRIPADRWVVWAVAGVVGLLLVATLAWGAWRFRPPDWTAAFDRLDRSLPGRPLTALADRQAIGAGDTASTRVWRAHVTRMAERAAGARAVSPDLDVSDRDRVGLRLMAATVFVVAVIFGSIWRIGGVTELGAPDPANALAGGPSWEGWIEPPAYTGLPSLYLNDQAAGSLELVEGTRITIRLYGEVGALSVSESISATASLGSEEATGKSDPAQEIEVEYDGALSIDGPGGRAWEILAIGDDLPEVELTGDLEWAADGEMRQPFTARDDFGVVAGQAVIALDLDSVDRRHGLSEEPEPREPLILDLPMPITGDRVEFTETLADNLSEHPWARLPVTIRLSVEDAFRQTGESEVQKTILPGRRFFDPLAKAVIEMRRDILWTRENGARTAQILRATTHRPDGFMRNEGVFLKLRTAIRRLEADLQAEAFDAEARNELAAVLWDIAMEIEFGNLNDARERLERAQDRLAEAIENGASDEEIAALMEELRRAMEEYMRQLAQNQDQNGENQQAQNDQMQEMTGQQLQDMLDRLQELMEQGRMAEAQQLLDQLRQMMENMQVTQGQGQQSPGQQAMDGLAETLREQQGLSDEAFRDLQEQFGQEGSGQSGENQGRNGGQGRGQQHDGQQGQPGQGEGEGDSIEQSLADRQQALRQELDRQRRNLPGAGTPEGDAARESIGRAGDAMDRAEDNLRQDDFAGALDNQAEAMEALREGMRELGQALAQQQQPGGQGQQQGNADPNGQRDPLGRDEGANGRLGTDEQMLQDDDVYRRARELLDEIRRRSSDRTRPDAELDYLRRLLDRF